MPASDTELAIKAYEAAHVAADILEKMFDATGKCLRTPTEDDMQWLVNESRILAAAVQEMERRSVGLKPQQLTR